MSADHAARPVVFTGSSIIAAWESLPRFFPEWHLLNTAVGGYQTHDVLAHAHEMLLRHAPRAVCYYCGSNDICNDVPPDTIIRNVTEAWSLVRAQAPDCIFIYLSVIRAPQKRGRMHVVDDVNARMAAMAATTPGMHFVDINPVFLAPDGTPRMEFYLEDELHLTPAAYEALGAYTAPRLRAIVAASTP